MRFDSKKTPPAPSTQRTRQKGALSFLLIGCFFLYVIFDSLSPHLPKFNEPPRLYANQCQRDLRLTLIEAIKRAKESIHLVMFGLSDAPTLFAIAQKAKEGLEVDIYYDPKGSGKLDLLLEGIAKLTT